VPSLFSFELLNTFLSAMRRKRIQAHDVIGIRSDLKKMPLLSEPAITDLEMEAIFTLAERHNLTFYDASYLELSLRLGVSLKTLDRDLLALRDTYSFIENQ
jgi:predicted nucleic acid-binding protein